MRFILIFIRLNVGLVFHTKYSYFFHQTNKEKKVIIGNKSVETKLMSIKKVAWVFECILDSSVTKADTSNNMKEAGVTPSDCVDLKTKF